MQNCPLKTSQIASVMALDARNCKIYGALPQTPAGGFITSCKRAYPADEHIVTKLNLYKKKQPLLKVLG